MLLLMIFDDGLVHVSWSSGGLRTPAWPLRVEVCRSRIAADEETDATMANRNTGEVQGHFEGVVVGKDQGRSTQGAWCCRTCLD